MNHTVCGVCGADKESDFLPSAAGESVPSMAYDTVRSGGTEYTRESPICRECAATRHEKRLKETREATIARMKAQRGTKKKRPLSEGQLFRLGQASGVEISPIRLRKLRQKAGLSQTELADALGITNVDSIRRWEAGAVCPHVNYVLRLLVACGETDFSAVLVGAG